MAFKNEPEIIKLSHCPPELKSIAQSVIEFCGRFKTTINGREVVILADSGLGPDGSRMLNTNDKRGN